MLEKRKGCEKEHSTSVCQQIIEGDPRFGHCEFSGVGIESGHLETLFQHTGYNMSRRFVNEFTDGETVDQVFMASENSSEPTATAICIFKCD